MKNKKVIFLIGFMGAGKSTKGRQLATEKGWDFVDLDDFIEKAEGKSIGEIFQEKGEQEFRILEKKYLREIPLNNPTVVATGGGTPCFSDNMEFMNSIGHTIYLREKVEVLFGRLKAEKNHRPKIKNMNDEELLHYIRITLKEREAFYLKCKEIL